MKYKYNKIKHLIASFGYLNCVDKLTWHPKTWVMRMIGHTARVYSMGGLLWVYESTTLNAGRSGVMVTLMASWLKAKAHQHVYYKACSFIDEFDKKIAEKAYHIHVAKHLGIPYPDMSQWKWRWYLVNAALDLGIEQLENVHQKKAMFCTQLSADLDVVCYIIPLDENPSEWEPDDCRDNSRLDEVHTEDVVIDDEIEIYY